MLSLKRPAILMLAAAALGAAQPALTTIQDTLYRADGSRFTGTVYITYNSFQGGGGANVATANLVLPIVNGILKAQLVPTTTASAGAQYSVRYNSRGINQFTEIWAVPPSTLPLRIRDVRVSQGAIVGPPPVVSPVQIPDVVGLENELAIRTLKGVGFGIGRTAVINQSGQLDAAAGALGDCVHVDGTAGPCSPGGATPSFADREIPGGVIDGANTVFTLLVPPSPVASLLLFRNGILLLRGPDYLLTTNTITFFSNTTPQPGDLLYAFYRFGSPNTPTGTLAPPQVVCSSIGAATSASASTRLGTCTIPAGLLGIGDRLEVQFDFGHGGTATGFSGEVRIGTTSIALRSTVAAETLVTGRSSFAVFSTGQVWNTQSWGGLLSFSLSTGQSAEDRSQDLLVDFRGQMAAGTTDTVILRNFTVIRYPAQSNP